MITTILGIATSVFAVTTIAAVAWAGFRQNYSKETVRVLNETLAAYKEREVAVDKKFAEQGKRIHDLEVKNASLQSELDTFKSIPLTQIADTLLESAKGSKELIKNQALIMKKLEIVTEE